MRGCWNLHFFLSQYLGAVILVTRLNKCLRQAEMAEIRTCWVQHSQQRRYAADAYIQCRVCLVLRGADKIGNCWLTTYLRANAACQKHQGAATFVDTDTSLNSFAGLQTLLSASRRAALSSSVSSSIMFNKSTAIIKVDIDPIYRNFGRRYCEVAIGFGTLSPGNQMQFSNAFDQRHSETCLALCSKAPRGKLIFGPNLLNGAVDESMLENYVILPMDDCPFANLCFALYLDWISERLS